MSAHTHTHEHAHGHAHHHHDHEAGHDHPPRRGGADHAHDHREHLRELGRKRLVIVLAMTAAFMVIEFAGGLLASGVRRFDQWIEEGEEEQRRTSSAPAASPNATGRGRS